MKQAKSNRLIVAISFTLLLSHLWSFGGKKPSLPPPDAAPTFKFQVRNGIGSGNFKEGTDVRVQSFTNDDSVVFSHWSGDTQFLVSDNKLSNGRYRTPNRDSQLTAVFKKKDIEPPPPPPEKFVLSINNGSGSGNYVAGSKVSLDAHDQSAQNLVFTHWSGTRTDLLVDPSASRTTLIMPNENISFQAEYQTVAIPVQRPYLGKTYTVPGLLQAEHYDEGGPGLAFADLEEENRGNANFRNTEHVDVYQLDNITQIGSSRPGEWIEYTFHSSTSDDFFLRANVATASSDGLINIYIDDEKVIHEYRVRNTGGWRTHKKYTLGAFFLEQGTHIMRMEFARAGSDGRNIADVDYFEFSNEKIPDPPTEKEDIFPNTAVIWMEARSANNSSNYGINKPIVMARFGKTANAVNVKIIHPWYDPWKSPKGKNDIQNFVKQAAREGYQGVAIDHEGWVAHAGPQLMQWFYEEANRQNIYAFSVPKFTMEHHSSLKIYNGEKDYDYRSQAWRNVDSATKKLYEEKTIGYFEKYSHGIVGWHYGLRPKQHQDMYKQWRERGYTKQIWPMVDEGFRGNYNSDYANEDHNVQTVKDLSAQGISMGIFNPKTNEKVVREFQKTYRGF